MAEPSPELRKNHSVKSLGLPLIDIQSRIGFEPGNLLLVFVEVSCFRTHQKLEKALLVGLISVDYLGRANF